MKRILKGKEMMNILDYLERTEEKYPEHIAVDDGAVRLTWKELAEMSRRAGSMVAPYIRSGDPVVILAEKSAVTLAAMLGTVYAGGFYVIVDPTLPAPRIQSIFWQLQPEAVVTEMDTVPRLEQTGYIGNIFILNDVVQGVVYPDLLESRRNKSRESDLLYGIFTSGSTGNPKGITVSHKAVIDFIGHFTEIFGLTEKEHIGNQAPFDFDVSVKDIYSCIMTGAALILIPRAMFSMPSRLLDYLCEKQVTIMIWAVSALTLVSALKGLSYRPPVHVKKIMFSGEVMPAKHLERWRKVLPHTEFVNLYGPTEITCNCTWYRIPEDFDETEKLPVGRPFPGRKVFLLDSEERKITESGNTGEICVAGESLAEGYYGNRVETEKKFMEYTSVDGKKERCYRTGDLGYFDDNGILYFVGRKDFQFKHMGHRIEPEEIEVTMNALSGVEKSCCVLDRKKNRIIAFYMGSDSPAEVRRQLKEKLPVYMIPHKILQTRNIPMNKNGKTDREHLKLQMEVLV